MTFERVFLVGAPRSGTSWLQAMLGAHPEVATPAELHLFDMYLKGWHQTWERQAHPTHGHEWRRLRGLASVLTRQDFDVMITQTIDTIHRRVMDAKPSATVLLEKTPDYSLYVEDIVRYVPEARFIHLIRDGRDVAVSLLAASDGLGTDVLAWRIDRECRPPLEDPRPWGVVGPGSRRPLLRTPLRDSPW